MSADSTVTIPTKRTDTCTQSNPCLYKVHVNQILITQKPQLVMLPNIYLKNKHWAGSYASHICKSFKWFSAAGKTCPNSIPLIIYGIPW